MSIIHAMPNLNPGVGERHIMSALCHPPGIAVINCPILAAYRYNRMASAARKIQHYPFRMRSKRLSYRRLSIGCGIFNVCFSIPEIAKVG